MRPKVGSSREEPRAESAGWKLYKQASQNQENALFIHCSLTHVPTSGSFAQPASRAAHMVAAY